MQVQPITNQADFKGIRLSNPEFSEVRNMAMHLKRTGLDCLGHKKVYCNNNISDKIKKAKLIRTETEFCDHEFGVVFFPWSNEAYIMATPAYEQFIFPIIKQYDKGASINWLI